jgi:hypothetical protein
MEVLHCAVCEHPNTAAVDALCRLGFPRERAEVALLTHGSLEAATAALLDEGGAKPSSTSVGTTFRGYFPQQVTHLCHGSFLIFRTVLFYVLSHDLLW